MHDIALPAQAERAPGENLPIAITRWVTIRHYLMGAAAKYDQVQVRPAGALRESPILSPARR
ncbi:hypothetical protein KCP75_15165 [Salmonella enterica subsp. enterica]|nr:hypothetical protein KCP75_15165 [Salmonella enterica subsp. enterica]